MLLEIAEALIKLGLPVGVLSWLLFCWLHHEGKLDIAADRKTVDAELKNMRKSMKQERKDKSNVKPSSADKRVKDTSMMSLMQIDTSIHNDPAKSANYIFNRWMWFGGGFYGLAALWTFVVIEIMDLFRFIFTFPGFAIFFEDGIVQVVIELIMNQIGNIIRAFVWFTYWSDGSIIVWVLVAYAGYLGGRRVARYKPLFD